MLDGLTIMTEAVAATLGPRGRSVIIERQHAQPEISRDGHTVARSIELGDRIADMGARLVREVAYQTDDDAGDGTTTAIVLTGAMVCEGIKLIAGGLAPLAVKRGIDRAITAALAGMEQRAQPVTSHRQLAQVGTISANGDADIGELLARAAQAIGADGFVVVEEGSNRDTELEIRDGMHVEGGYISAHFVTDSERMVVEMEEPFILVCDAKIASFDAIEPALRAFAKSDKCLVVVAEDIVGEALATLVVNSRDGDLKVAAVRAPGAGRQRKAMLEDMALMTGAELITPELGRSIEKLRPDMLGRAAKAVIDGKSTIVIEGQGPKKAVENRCRELRAAIGRERYLAYDREQLQKRLARLVGGIAVVRVGGDTEVELKHRKEVVSDAVNATRAAIAGGIVPGGGLALAACLADLVPLTGASLDEQAGIEVVRRALTAPLRRIADNAGEDGVMAVARVLKRREPGWGFDARRGTYGDLMKSGVIDPVRVVRAALANAASAAGLVITTGAVVAEHPKTKRVVSAFPGE